MKTKLIEKLIEKLVEDGVDDEQVNEEGPFKIGQAYLIRTVTMHQIGILKDIQGDFLIFKDASWVADSGRFSECISKGTFNEVEYVGNMGINKTAIVDFFPWENKVPKETK
jgi:hypothetical protein